MAFFEYHQNNSYGSFTVTDAISEFVIIEAANSKEADQKAETLGIYFDGGGDCPCCGDRWRRADADGDDVPSLYGEPVEKFETSYSRKHVDIHYADGRHVRMEPPKR
jgi:hypothetical protein